MDHAVDRLLSCTRAAQELHLTQPTVSMQLKKLESYVGLPFTEQVGTRVSLTATGSTLHGAARDIQERMANNRDDLYLIGKPPESSELEFRPCLMNPMVVVAPAGHRLAGRKALPIAEIPDEHFIVREQGSGTRIALVRQFAEAGHALTVRMERGRMNRSSRVSRAGRVTPCCRSTR